MAQNVYQFFIEPALQELFRDKDTGLPLSSGTVEFYRDKARTEPKPVYELTGTPADPVYVPLPNPITLTGIGSASDGANNDIKWYYNPFDANGDVDLYFIKVFNSQGVEQFTREGWPQQIQESSVSSLSFFENFFQDGQFLNHLDVPNNGLLENEITNLAYGGWVFVLPTGFTSVNTVLFDRFPDYVVNPTVSPRYAIRVSTVSPNPAEPFKDLTWVNNNVNFLADKTVTLQLEALSNNGFPTNIEIFYQKVYGTGGSPTDEVFVGSFTIDPTDWEKYTTSFTISDNLTKTIGPDNDDEIRFIVRFPSDVSFDMSLVDFILTEGQFEVLDYPETSDYQAKLNSLASSISKPKSDNSNEGDVLTLGGRTDTEIGEDGTPLAALIWLPAVPIGACLPFAAQIAPLGYLNCDGLSYDLVGSSASDNNVRLFNVIGTANGYGADTYVATKALVSQSTFTSTRFGVSIAPDEATSGFTITVTVPGDPTTLQVATIDTITGNLIPPGSHFEIFSPTGKSSVYWFTIDGAGTDPSGSFPTSLVQLVPLLSTDTSDQVADKLNALAITQVQVPDFRGMFLRGWDDGRGLDPDAADRLDPTFTNIVGDIVGSVEEDSLQDHVHDPFGGGSGYFSRESGTIPQQGAGLPQVNFPATTGFVNTTDPTNAAKASPETRPVNAYVNFIIKC